MENVKEEGVLFESLGISSEILLVLKKLHYTVPTLIQQKAIMPSTEGKDVVGIAQTGTGKTLAFAVPMLQRLMEMKGKIGLVVVPTRELAAQVEETFVKVGGPLGVRTALLIGGAAMGPQLGAIRRGPHVIIGTPGRINDHLSQGTFKGDTVAILVLDEADHMFDMGFLPQIKDIISTLPSERQTLLFSATMPQEIFTLASRHMKTPLRIEIARAGTIADRMDQEIFVVTKDQKNRLLEKLLMDYKGAVLIFCRTKHGAKKLCANIRVMGHGASEIHSNRSLGQRREALDSFKSGSKRVLVATDIAARGIDVTGIELVVNYDLPEQAEDYVHRIGRTGRAGLAGKAVSLVTADQYYKVKIIERLIRMPIAVSKLPVDLPAYRTPVYVADDEPSAGRSRFGGASRPSRFASASPRKAYAPRSTGSFQSAGRFASSRPAQPASFGRVGRYSSPRPQSGGSASRARR
ncbi:MAG: DEAD/DEAH box helicase [Candidatus Pacebacteria bacterium]|nr:DEAD/DEAH box helicase [Candidatus Paceibacterota bacterium]